MEVSEEFYINAQIYHILANFDFNKVHRTMEFLEWSWFDTDGTPTIDDLREAAWSKLQSAYSNSKGREDGKGYCSSGGFEARYEDGGFSLSFTVTEWDSYDMIVSEEERLSQLQKCSNYIDKTKTW